MPKSRKATTQHCSFCGAHKNDVPLIVTSQLNTQAACCSTCALTIVHQTQSWAYGIFQRVVEEQARHQQAQVKIVTGDGVDAAIRKSSTGQ